MATEPSSAFVLIDDDKEDLQAFQMHPIIWGAELSAELFASNGDIVLICGKGNQEKQGILLVSYEIRSTTSSLASKIRLLRVIELPKKRVTQLETIPIMKIALLLGDGIVSILDIDSLAEITRISSHITLFATCYDIASSSSSTSSSVVPTELRICVASKRRALNFFRWCPQQQRVEEDKNLHNVFGIFDTPHAIAFCRDRICIGYKKSYVIMSLTTGVVINEYPFTMAHDPVITCLQDRTQWCIQMEATTIFLNSHFEQLYENGITWKDISSAVVQAGPYVLALMNQSIDICIFNGMQSVPVQRIPYKGSSAIGKCLLWTDARTKRIYAATPADVVLLRPIPVDIQLQNYIDMYRYDLALFLIRDTLEISVSSSVNDPSRTNDGHAKGDLDISAMPKVITFGNTEQISPESSSAPSLSRSLSQTPNKTVFWCEYYRVGTMYAFQLFHKQQFEQAFAAFNEYLTDPTEIISLFEVLSPDTWLTHSSNALKEFIKKPEHFFESNDFVGVQFENALHQLELYLTDSNRVFQTIFRCSPDAWLEVQSPVHNCLILKPVRDLLTIVQTALLKVYLINNNNNDLVNALLRDRDNCCLPSEVEKDLKKYSRRTELVLFYEQQNRHDEALQIIFNINLLSFSNAILNYLSKLDNNRLPLIFKYIEPIIKLALEEKDNKELLDDILVLFIGELTSPSAIKFDPVEVYNFLKEINQDFARRYLENICLKSELDDTYYDQLSDELKRLMKAKQPESQNNQQNT